MPIEFRCLQCQHLQKVDESKIGQHVYCKVCYFKLTVPAESTVKPIEETQPSKLYALDTAPLDVQKMQERREELISFPCDLCKTLIGVKKEQVGEEIICPECGKKIIVPKLVAAMAEARLQDKHKKVSALLSRKETYLLRSETDVLTDVPVNERAKQFRVPCQLCGTVMFATEAQIGTFLTCHDCETKTEVLPPQKTLPSTSKTSPLPPSSFEGNTTYNIATAASVSPTEELVPVVCGHCGTRMHAAESQIGQFKTCPDCGRQTEIKAVPKPRRPTTETTSADAYKLGKADESAPRPAFRMFFRNNAEWLAELALRAKGRPPLPKRPLTERFFVPFSYYETWLYLLLLAGAGLFGMLMIAVGIWIAGILGIPGVVAVVLIGPLVFLLYVATFCYLASFAVQFYDSTCGGMDEFEFKGEIVPFDYLLIAIWLLSFAALSTTPGLVLGNALCQSLGLIADSPVTASLVIYVMIRISHWLLFPIFFLSSMESGSMFAVLAKNTVASLWHLPFAWLRFYLLTGMLFILADLCLFAAMWLSSLISFFVWIAFFFFLFALQTLFFFRLLGRLAWLIEEASRQKYEREEEDDEDDER